MRRWALTEDERGQSIIEFVFMLPMLAGLTALMTHVNTAIQMSIVNQQYARAQALNLTFSSPYYPAQIRPGDPDKTHAPRYQMVKESANQMVLGVSDNIAGSGSGDYTPVASQQMIARKKSLAPPNPLQDESAHTMGWVRIRNSVTLCTDSFTAYREVDNGYINYGNMKDDWKFQDICRPASAGTYR